MDYKIDSFKYQFHQLATVSKRMEEKEKTVFGIK